MSTQQTDLGDLGFIPLDRPGSKKPRAATGLEDLGFEPIEQAATQASRLPRLPATTRVGRSLVGAQQAPETTPEQVVTAAPREFGKTLLENVVGLGRATYEGIKQPPQTLAEKVTSFVGGPGAVALKRLVFDPQAEQAKTALESDTLAGQVGHAAAAAVPMLGPWIASESEKRGGELGEAWAAAEGGEYSKAAERGLTAAGGIGGDIATAEFLKRAPKVTKGAVGEVKTWQANRPPAPPSARQMKMLTPPSTIVPAEQISPAELQAAATNHGIQLTGPQVTGSRIGRGTQAVLERGLASGGPLEDLATANREQFIRWHNEATDAVDPGRIGSTTEGAGAYYQKTVPEGFKAASKANREQYLQVPTDAPDVGVNVAAMEADYARELQNQARTMTKEPARFAQMKKEFLRKAATVSQIDLTPQARARFGIKTMDGVDMINVAGRWQPLSTLDPRLATQMDIEIPRLGEIPLPMAIRLRSDYWHLAHDFASNIPNEVQSMYRRYVSRMDQAIQTSLEANQDRYPGALERWREANKRKAELEEIYNDRQSPLTQVLDTQDASRIPGKLATTPRAVQLLRREGHDLGPLKHHVINEIALKNYSLVGDKLGGFHHEFLQELFSPDELTDLYQRGKVARVMRFELNPSGTSNAMILEGQLRRTGRTLAGGVLPLTGAGAGFVAGGPLGALVGLAGELGLERLLAKGLVSPRVTDWLTKYPGKGRLLLRDLITRRPTPPWRPPQPPGSTSPPIPPRPRPIIPTPPAAAAPAPPIPPTAPAAPRTTPPAASLVDQVDAAKLARAREMGYHERANARRTLLEDMAEREAATAPRWTPRPYEEPAILEGAPVEAGPPILTPGRRLTPMEELEQGAREARERAAEGQPPPFQVVERRAAIPEAGEITPKKPGLPERKARLAELVEQRKPIPGLRPEVAEEGPTAPLRVEGEPASGLPERAGGPRWEADRGAIPGEPMQILDDGKAAIIEREIPETGNVAYEAVLESGESVGVFDHLEEAAAAAEAAVDQARPQAARQTLLERMEARAREPKRLTEKASLTREEQEIHDEPWAIDERVERGSVKEKNRLTGDPIGQYALQVVEEAGRMAADVAGEVGRKGIFSDVEQGEQQMSRVGTRGVKTTQTGEDIHPYLSGVKMTAGRINAAVKEDKGNKDYLYLIRKARQNIANDFKAAELVNPMTGEAVNPAERLPIGKMAHRTPEPPDFSPPKPGVKKKGRLLSAVEQAKQPREAAPKGIRVERRDPEGQEPYRASFFNPRGKSTMEYGEAVHERVIYPKKTLTVESDHEGAIKQLFDKKEQEKIWDKFDTLTMDEPDLAFKYLDDKIREAALAQGYDSLHYLGKEPGVDMLSGEQWVVLDREKVPVLTDAEAAIYEKAGEAPPQGAGKKPGRLAEKVAEQKPAEELEQKAAEARKGEKAGQANPLESWPSPEPGKLAGYRSDRYSNTKGPQTPAGDITGTEGRGLYVAKSKQTAEFFGPAKKVTVDAPKKPLIVNEEPLHLLQQTDEIMEPIKPTDSEWTRLNKQAVIDAGATEENWGYKEAQIQDELTKGLRNAGYDAVVVRSGGEEWVVLLDQGAGKKAGPVAKATPALPEGPTPEEHLKAARQMRKDSTMMSVDHPYAPTGRFLHPNGRLSVGKGALRTEEHELVFEQAMKKAGIKQKGKTDLAQAMANFQRDTGIIRLAADEESGQIFVEIHAEPSQAQLQTISDLVRRINPTEGVRRLNAVIYDLYDAKGRRQASAQEGATSLAEFRRAVDRAYPQPEAPAATQERKKLVDQVKEAEQLPLKYETAGPGQAPPPITEADVRRGLRLQDLENPPPSYGAERSEIERQVLEGLRRQEAAEPTPEYGSVALPAATQRLLEKVRQASARPKPAEIRERIKGGVSEESRAPRNPTEAARQRARLIQQVRRRTIMRRVPEQR